MLTTIFVTSTILRMEMVGLGIFSNGGCYPEPKITHTQPFQGATRRAGGDVAFVNHLLDFLQAQAGPVTDATSQDCLSRGGASPSPAPGSAAREAIAALAPSIMRYHARGGCGSGRGGTD